MNAPKRFQVATLIAALIATIALVVAPALTVQAATKLAAPTGVKAQVTSSSASISWNKVSGASSYQICLLTNGSTTKCYRKSHKDSRTKVTFYNLKPTGGRDYFYKVYAYSGSKSSVSPKKSFDLASRPVSTSATKPAAVTGLKASVTGNSARISWNKATGADSYYVCLLTNGTTTTCAYKSARNANTTATFTGLKPTGGTDYFYKVYAHKGSASSVSAKYSFNLAAPGSTPSVPLTAPTGVKVAMSYNTATVSWQPVQSADSYQACLMTKGDTLDCYRKSAKNSQTSATFTKLAPTGGADYFVQVTAYRGTKSMTSGKSRFDLPTSPLTNFTVKDFYTTWLEFGWSKATNADKYEVQIATDEGMTKGLRTLTSTPTALKATSLKLGETYYFRARPFNGSVAGAYTAVASHVMVTEPFNARVLTYNLCGQDKCVTTSNGMKKWSTRKPIAGALVRSTNSDVIATQESQSKDTNFGTELKGYTLASYYSAKSLYYRTAKFTKVRSGIITLNKSRKRYAVWAELQNKATRSRFIVANAHLEPYKGKTYDDLRKAQTKVLIATIAKANTAKLPVVYAGDYNSNGSNAQKKYLGGYDAPRTVFEDAGIPDAMDAAATVVNDDYNSANQAINPPYRHGHHVDHIYLDPRIEPLQWQVMIRLSGKNYATPFATDHNPLFTAMTVPGQG